MNARHIFAVFHLDAHKMSTNRKVCGPLPTWPHFEEKKLSVTRIILALYIINIQLEFFVSSFLSNYTRISQ